MLELIANTIRILTFAMEMNREEMHDAKLFGNTLAMHERKGFEEGIRFALIHVHMLEEEVKNLGVRVKTARELLEEDA